MVISHRNRGVREGAKLPKSENSCPRGAPGPIEELVCQPFLLRQIDWRIQELTQDAQTLRSPHGQPRGLASYPVDLQPAPRHAEILEEGPH